MECWVEIFECFSNSDAQSKFNVSSAVGPAVGSVSAQYLLHAFDLKNFRAGADKEMLNNFKRPADSPVGPVPKIPGLIWNLFKKKEKSYYRHLEESYQDTMNFIIQGATITSKLATL